MGTELTPPLFSRRDRYSIVLFSVSFIAFSAIVHTLVGGASSGLFPKFTVQPTPSPQIIILDSPTPKPRISPTPTPRPTPPPPTPKVTAPPMRVHPPILAPSSTKTSGPIERQFSPSPIATPFVGAAGSSSPPTIQPTITQTSEPISTATDSTFRYKAPVTYPEIPMQEGIGGIVVVLVTIGPDASLLDATIDESSGNAALDAAALVAARASLYTAPLRDGKPVTQQYKIVYEFNADG
jgi:TonB family protein